MSQENVATLLEASKAASAGAMVKERESFLSILDPEIEWIAREGPPDLQGEFHGIERAREYYARWASAWAEWDWEIEEARGRGNLVVTRTWLTGRGRGAGWSWTCASDRSGRSGMARSFDMRRFRPGRTPSKPPGSASSCAAGLREER